MSDQTLYNSINIASLIKDRAKQQGIILKDMLSELNLGSNTMSNMRHNRMIAADSLARIADYLDCSVDYLLGRVSTPEVSNAPKRENIQNHDLVGQYGFNVDPELLAHDLAMLKLSKQDDIQELHEGQLYDAYTKLRKAMEVEIDGRIRFDQSFGPDQSFSSSSK